MDIAFKEPSLEALSLRQSTGGYSSAIVESYIDRLAIIRAAPDEAVFRQLQFLKYRRLSGRGKRAMRLVDSTDLFLRLRDRGTIAVIEAIRKRRRSAA